MIIETIGIIIGIIISILGLYLEFFRKPKIKTNTELDNIIKDMNMLEDARVTTRIINYKYGFKDEQT